MERNNKLSFPIENIQTILSVKDMAGKLLKFFLLLTYGIRFTERTIGFKLISKRGKTSLKYMSDKNGSILFGTDTPSSPTYGNPPGYNGYLEMLEMQNAGVPLSKILATATINNAEAFKLEKLYGTVEKGKKANLLILNKNPLEDITAYNDISQIIIKGKRINRNTLSATEIEK